MKAATGAAGQAATPGGNGSETAPPALRRQKMQAIVQDTYGAAERVARRRDRPARDRRQRGTREGPRRRAGPGHLAPHGRPAVPDAPHGLRLAHTQEPRSRARRRRHGRGGRRRGDQVRGRRRGLRHQPGFLRRVRVRPARTSSRASRRTSPSSQAAAVAVSGLTALQGLRDAGRLQPGQHVLIIGASGGVGTFAVQIAKAFGAEVTGVCSTAKTDLVASIGADHVIDYSQARLRRRSPALRPHPRHRRQLTAVPAAARADPGRNARHRRRRRRRPLDRNGPPAAGPGPLTVRAPAAHHAHLQSSATPTSSVSPSSSEPASSPRSSTRPTRCTRRPDAMRHLEAGHAQGKLVITVRDAG